MQPLIGFRNIVFWHHSFLNKEENEQMDRTEAGLSEIKHFKHLIFINPLNDFKRVKAAKNVITNK